jgi:hypothetical protein
MRIRQPAQHLAQNGDGVIHANRPTLHKRPETRAGDELHGQIRRVGVWIEAERADNVGMRQPVHGDALALEVAQVLRVSRYLDRDQTVGPDVVMRPPHLAERPGRDAVR